MKDELQRFAGLRARKKQTGDIAAASRRALLERARNLIHSQNPSLAQEGRTAACEVATSSSDPELVRLSLDLITESLHGSSTSQERAVYDLSGLELISGSLDWSDVVLEGVYIGITLSLLVDYVIDLSGAVLKDSKVVIEAALCERAHLRFNGAQIDPYGIRFWRAHFKEAVVDFSGVRCEEPAVFRFCTLNRSVVIRNPASRPSINSFKDSTGDWELQ